MQPDRTARARQKSCADVALPTGRGIERNVMKRTVVVAEDDEAIRELILHHLACEGFEGVGASDGLSAIRKVREGCDLIVLDLGLPGLDGFEVARRARDIRAGLPILVLSARSGEIDRLLGFELGIDDFVAKPFSPRELVARVRAILRRHGLDAELPVDRVLRFGDLEIDVAAREVRMRGLDLACKPREFALLLELARNPGVAIARERLIDRVWGAAFVGDERTVDVHVSRLRARLEGHAPLRSTLRSVHGFGYKFVPP